MASLNARNDAPSKAPIFPDSVTVRFNNAACVCSCGSFSRLVECPHTVHTAPVPAS